MECCTAMPNRGPKLKPEHKWYGKDKAFQFRIIGMSDSDYVKYPMARWNVNGYSTFLEDDPITVKSPMQRIVVLSVTKAEAIAGVQCVQDMLYIKNFLESMVL
eukprot:12841978-Ditylum_brightwellii.AAC.1